MGGTNTPRAEKGSCRQLGYLLPSTFCSPCWEQFNKTKTFYRNCPQLQLTGCCFQLYPNAVAKFKAADPSGKYWNDREWKPENWKTTFLQNEGK